MFSEKFMEVRAHDGVVSITSWADDEAHVINTFNNYLQIADDKLLIPAGGMVKTEKNVEKNNRVILSVASSVVQGHKHMGAGFLIHGTAKYLKSGPNYDMMKEKFPWISRALEISVSSIKQTH